MAFHSLAGLPEGMGPIVSVDGMLPGTVATGTLTIGAAVSGPLVLRELPVPAGGSGDASMQLQLTVADQTTGATLYAGPLGQLPETPVCGRVRSGCAAWLAGESHGLSFAVTLPAASGNSFQGAAAEAVFTWSQPPGGVAGVTTGPISAPSTGVAAGWPQLAGAAALLCGVALLLFGAPFRRRPLRR